jgi:hypothetical protein
VVVVVMVVVVEGGAVKYSSKYGKYCIVGGDYERSRTAMEFVVL